MTPEKIVLIISIFLVISLLAVTVFMRLPKRLKHDKFVDRWRALQSKCSDKARWQEAVIEADNLLAEALKKKKIKGTTTGERLVSAQKIFSDNDAVWFGHKLRTKIEGADADSVALKKDDVKKALMGIGKGLKDIGALR